MDIGIKDIYNYNAKLGYPNSFVLKTNKQYS